ncbi:NAD(P)/FAD-dependent oxidoreductase [Streptomyces acidiscabies]|uniref:NAD(P)/FAD-dependent oxidoreductase n=1 Tax=Streptomyces acidiscabies TaxID=42234 RepID=UPI00073EEAF6|nr:FAD-dependent oxidoreductase [Streptomyces acidiscabies]GAQ54594.1 NADH dehydrogenase-like protein YjlD [Streptomyces acidiscabies]
MNGNTEVVVVGGGYAGVMAANRLMKRGDVAVTLVNPRPEFVQRIRLHQLAAGTHDAVVEYGKVLNARVRLLVDSVTRIDAAERQLATSNNGTLSYDYLVYAVGSAGAGQHTPGVREFAHPLATLEDAAELKALLAARPDAPVTVVGGGATGIEMAAELAEQGRKSTLICGGVLNPYLHPKARRTVMARLTALGVTVLEGASAMEVTEHAVRLEDGTEIPSELTVWTTGFGVPDLAKRSGLSTDALGRLLTDDTLTSVDDDRIVAAGDSAAPAGQPYRMGCQSAVQLGPQAAETVLSRIGEAQPAPVKVAFAGQCISLGRRTGIFQFSQRDDTAKKLHVSGRTGGRVKEFVCRGTVWQLTMEAKKFKTPAAPASAALNSAAPAPASPTPEAPAHSNNTPAATAR